MSINNGTYVLFPIVPPDSNDTFPTHYSKYGQGGLKSVIDLTERDGIPDDRREIGMLCYVQKIDKLFQLKGGITNTCWTEFVTGSSGTGGGGTGDMSKYIYDTNSNGIVDRAEKVNWDGIEYKPTEYKPSAHSHNATDITTDLNHQFVTSTQTNSWDLKQDPLGFIPENSAKKGIANGYASLDGTGKIPLNQLPNVGSQKVFIVADAEGKKSLTNVNNGDICYERSTSNSYIYEAITNSWLTMVDKDWANINISWSNIAGKPTSVPNQIDLAVSEMHSHSNEPILDATTESFTTALKNSIGNAQKIKGTTIDDSAKTNGYVLTYKDGIYILAPQTGGTGTGNGDMLKSTYDSNNDGIVDHADLANKVSWSGVTEKPSNFVPSLHKATHSIGGSDFLSPADIGAATNSDLTNHLNNLNNPHQITKSQVGLGNLTNDTQVKRSEMGASNGVATLGTDGKIPTSQLPAMNPYNTFVASAEAEMLGLTANQGDMCIRTDLNKTFVLKTVPASKTSNWQELLTSASVTSVNSKTGSVTLTTTDISEGTNLYYTDARVSANPTLSGHISNSNNPHNVTKTQIGLSNVTNDAQVKRSEIGIANGIATLDNSGKIPTSQLPSIVSGVSSVNTKTGEVVLSTTDILEGVNLYYTDGRVDNRINSNSIINSLTSHSTNVSNPHSVTKTQIGLSNVSNDAQVKRIEMGIANGVATLDATGKIPTSQIPPLAINNTFVVNSQNAMLGLTASQGDIAIRIDISKSYILQTTPASNIANWQELLSPTGDSVLSVNGKTGNITLTTNNINEGTNLYYTDARVAAAPALVEHISNTSNPHSVTKSQIGLVNVTNDAQVKRSEMGIANGVATLGADGKLLSSQLPNNSGGGSGSSGSSIIRYEASGSSNGQCLVLATGAGVSFSIAGSDITLTCPAGVQLITARIFVPGTSITANNVKINLGSGIGNGTGNNTTYNDCFTPSYQAWTAYSGAYVYRPTTAANMNTGANVLQFTGLQNGSNMWFKLIF